jgi:hypothetical protein
MPVYHFTLHAYRSWRPDNKRGYVRRGGKLLPPDPKQAQNYDDRAKDEPAVFTTEVQRILIHTAADFCSRRKLSFHAAGSDPSHIHYVIS